MARTNYRFVHLSDIHFGQEKNGVLHVYEDIRAQLLRDCKQQFEAGDTPTDGILITGDLAYKGSHEEYQRAGDWIDELVKAVGCDVILVRTIPGNHDIDRTKIHHSCKLAHRDLRSKRPEQVDECLAELLEENEESPILRKIAAYREFASRFGCDFESARKPMWRRDYPFEGGRVLVMVGMNSVQVSDGDDDLGKMVLGGTQYVLPEADNVEYFALVHHPMPWLNDRAKASRYLTMRARILIVGHEHELNIQKVQDATGAEQLQIYAGAVTPPEQELDFRYNWIDISLVEGKEAASLRVKVIPRLWDRNSTRFVPDLVRLQGKTSFDLACPMFSASPNPAQEAQGVPGSGTEERSPMVTSHDADLDFERLQYFFWHLNWDDRLKALVDADVLPTLPSQPMPQTLERLALDAARKNGALVRLWDCVMESVPEGKRASNPFRANTEG
jgi:calcineurin-like phosphoesterase family protein